MLCSTYHLSICIGGFTIGVLCSTSMGVLCITYHLAFYIYVFAIGVLCSTPRLDGCIVFLIVVAALLLCVCWLDFQDISFWLLAF